MKPLFLKIIQFFVLSLLLTAQLTAFAGNDLVSEKAFYEDSTGEMTFAEVKSKTFTPYKDILNKGYSSSAFWVRIKLDETQLQVQEKFAIKITPTYLDEIALFDGSSNEPIQTVGDRYPIKNNAVGALNFNFISSFERAQPYMWMRLQTTSTNLINVEALKPDELNETNFSAYLFGGLLLGVFCVFAFLGAIYFFIKKEVINGVFFLDEIAALMLMASLMGYVRLMLSSLLSPDSIDHLTSYFICTYTLITLSFYKFFFDEYKPKKWVHFYFAIALSLIVIALGLLTYGRSQQALSLNMKVIATSSVTFFLIPLAGLDWKNITNPVLSKRILLLTQMHSLIAVLYSALPSLGLIGANRYSAYTGLIHPAITSLIMMLMVSYRAITQNKERAMEIAEKTRRIEHQKAQKEMQAQFMAMLTHELRTPLSVLRLALPNKATIELTGRAKYLADQAIDDMQLLIERCTQLDKLDQGLQPVNLQRVRVAALVDNMRERFANKLELEIIGSTKLEVLCDATLLQIILNNLLDNALKYGAPTRPVSIHLQYLEDSHFVRIGVQNELLAQAKLNGDELFEKFYRDPSAQQVTGTGLGLYIVRGMCELMDGKAYADVSAANSITMWVELPKV